MAEPEKPQGSAEGKEPPFVDDLIHNVWMHESDPPGKILIY
jgi:hypothetical protein